MRNVNPLVDLVSRVPARVEVKLLAAFLIIEVLLILMGAVGLPSLQWSSMERGRIHQASAQD